MSAEKTQLTAEGCRARQRRLRKAMADLEIGRAIVCSREHVQWLTGFRPHALMSAAAVLDAEGDCLLIAPNSEPDFHGADEVLTFEAQWQATLRQEQVAAIGEVLSSALKNRPSARTGVEFSFCGPHLSNATGAGPAGDLDPALFYLRRRKEDDEAAMIRHAIGCTDAMYRRAREIIAPGISELEVFNQLHAAAVEHAGEALTALGNDYQVNAPGGPARDGVVAEDGQLYILDLGPAYRGYFADNCRTIAVNGVPTDSQQQAWEAIVSVFDIVEEMVRPGASCRELYNRCKARMDEADPGGSFWHHLGHGIGLYPHEAPHLNPNWDDTFEEGDIFTVEPGLYTDELRAGIRLEENYRVTAAGIEKLTHSPLEL